MERDGRISNRNRILEIMRDIREIRAPNKFVWIVWKSFVRLFRFVDELRKFGFKFLTSCDVD